MNYNLNHREVEKGPHTVWIDNFSKVHGCKIPNIDIGAWRDCLWTGVALKKYVGAVPVSTAVQVDPEGNIVPAMPDDLFEKERRFVKLFDRHKVTATSYQTDSLVRQWKVNTVPLKPVAARVDNDQWRAALQGDQDKLSVMYPKELIAENIGSNLGLASVMREHYESRQQHIEGMCEDYSALNVDENIFMRIIKVAGDVTTKHTNVNV